ncbi:MAG TPA: hypothetical protein VGN72_14495, partial [Tepidisphaeraceae bacterium]|nr:hypothetical protein [Tepidisphaeraceae bacterium]
MATLFVKIRPTPRTVTAPSAPTNVGITTSVNGVVATFIAVDGTHAHLYEDGIVVATVALPATTISYAGTVPGVEHTYQVVAFDVVTGESTASATYKATRPFDPMPVGLTVTASPELLRFEWEPAAVPAAVSFWRGTIERLLDQETLDADGEPAIVPEYVPETIDLPTATLEYLDTGSEVGRETRFYLQAVNALGHASERALVRATRPPPPPAEEPPKPAAPEVFTATYSGTSIVIVYSATHPVRISRRDAGGSAYVLLATDTATPFTDEGIDPAKGYDYQFETFDGELASAPVTIQARPVPVVIVVTGNIHVDAD